MIVISGDRDQGLDRRVIRFCNCREVGEEGELVLGRKGNFEAGFIDGEGVIVEVSVERGGDVGEGGVVVGAGVPEASSHCSRAGALRL